jgi:hypothetical protein
VEEKKVGRGERENSRARVVNVTEEMTLKLCRGKGPRNRWMSFILVFRQLSVSHWCYYSLSSLAALIILSLAYSRFRGLFGPDDKNMSLTVKWGRERFVYSLLGP